MKKISKHLVIMLMIISLLTGYIIGQYVGQLMALNWAAEKAIYFLHMKGIEIDIDSKTFAMGLLMYQNKIDGWTDNEIIHNNSGD